MKRRILTLLQLGFVLTFLMGTQGCSSATSSSAPSVAASGIDEVPDVSNIQKIPTSPCDLNGVTYQCVTIAYGNHSLQNYELWLPTAAHISGDRPLVVFFHGGGYYEGDKIDGYATSSGMADLLKAGYAVATANYRLVDEFPFVMSEMEFPLQFQDAAWAVQDLRMRASHYNYNPAKVALTGVSAGGGLSLWLAFHDDLKNSASNETRDRFSSKVDCVAVRDAQTTINIGEIQDLLGPGYTLGHGIPTMFGFTEEEYLADPDLIQQTLGSSMSNASAIAHLSVDDANVKVMLSYLYDYGTTNIHAPEFGQYFAEGLPASVKNKYGRKSLTDLGIAYTLKTKQGPVLHKNNMVNHINSCFAK